MKQIFPFLFFLFVSEAAQSSHLMGGQITARQISGLTYEVTMTLYRDTYGIPIGTTGVIRYENADILTPWTASHTVPNVGAPFINATEEYVYIDSVTFPRNGTFTVSYSSCCRNAAILNGPNGGSSFYLHTTFEVNSANPNSTPVFLNKPITVAGINNLWTYNPLPYDADGDSLAWHLAIPLDGPNLPCPYVPPFADSSQPFTLDSLTGQITWIPNTLGNFVASFLVEEYRGGIKIGEIRRDMQIIVITMSGARIGIMSGTWPLNTDGHFEFALTSTNAFTLPVAAFDMDLSVVDLEVSGEPFLFPTNPAQWTLLSNGAGSATVQIDWTPGMAQQRDKPYLITNRSSETNGSDVLCRDITVLLRVNAPTAIPQEPKLPVGAIYPTLVKGELNVPVSWSEAARLEITVLNSMGQQAMITETMKPAGNHVIRLEHLDLSPGMYFLKISDGKRESVQQFVVTNR